MPNPMGSYLERVNNMTVQTKVCLFIVACFLMPLILGAWTLYDAALRYSVPAVVRP